MRSHRILLPIDLIDDGVKTPLLLVSRSPLIPKLIELELQNTKPDQCLARERNRGWELTKIHGALIVHIRDEVIQQFFSRYQLQYLNALYSPIEIMWLSFPEMYFL